MARTEKKAEILADLFRINKDCSASYQHIIDRTRSQPVQRISPFLQRLISLERNCIYELRRQLDTAFGDPADAVDMRGEIYQGWQELKNAGTPMREYEICAFCERSLRAMNQAYDKALQFGADFSEQVRSMLTLHINRFQESFDSLKQFMSEKSGNTRELAYA
jgi:uncharacterized protein (TIGR02284 family)